MGFIRGGLLVFVSVIFLVVLLLSGIFLVLSLSLKYENVEKSFIQIAKNMTQSKLSILKEDFNLTKEIEEIRKPMEDYCQNNTEYNLSLEGQNFTLRCSALEKLNETPDALIEEGVSSIVQFFYYKNYDNCGFWDCLSKESLSNMGANKDLSFIENSPALVLVSNTARIYWQEKFYYFLAIILILIILIFLLAEQKQNALIITGALIILSSLAIFKIEKIAEFFAGSYSLFVELFFSKTGVVFKAFLILGILMVTAGITLRFVYWDSLKKKFSKKDVENIVKKEVDKKSSEKQMQK